MKRLNVILSIISFTLLGCTATYNASMKIEDQKDNFMILFGSIEPMERNTMAWKKILIKVSDGEITCEGYSETEDWGFSGSMFRSKYRHNVPITCNNGTSGSLVLTVNWDGRNRQNQVSGQGIGRMNDGKKLKVILGDTSASLNW